ncbi:MAG: DUF554 domain-containing protein [Oscillospiraceae bacterium]|nr:DUF554 domain-containing protein [Oscillospiraceae bacterium]
MLGTVVNAAAVIIGSLIGMVVKKGIPEKVRSAVMVGVGLCTIYIGVSGMLSGENVIVAVLSILVGVIIGTLLDIDGGLERLGGAIEKKFGKKSDSSVARGFVSGSLLFCVGAMAVTGSLASGLTGDHSIIYTKSVLDFISALMLTASLGIGVGLSAVSVFVFQGAIVLLAQVLAPVLNASAINEMTCVGSLMIIALGFNLIGIAKIKIANFLPAIALAPVFSWLAALLTGFAAKLF